MPCNESWGSLIDWLGSQTIIVILLTCFAVILINLEVGKGNDPTLNPVALHVKPLYYTMVAGRLSPSLSI